ncbi:MAG: endonuclease/exonuclease/phosphatase family protein [Pseudomonadota bacterium]
MTGGARTGEKRPALTLATLNLYHWAAPPLGWYGPDEGHSEASWAAKRLWLAEILREMDADVVGFQEVVSVEALREDCAAAGYPYLAAVAEPAIREARADPGAPAPERAAFYRRPVNAVAARFPITTAPARVHPALPKALGLAADRDFRRPVVRAEIEAPGVGPVLVYCAHLKSPGVSERDAPMQGLETPPEDAAVRARWSLEGLSRAAAYAMIQRMFEATALQHAAMADIAAAPERPVALLGDLNDTPESAALQALTPFAAFERDGGAEVAAAAPIGGDPSADLYRLVDAARLAARDLRSDARAPTHRAGASGEAIDHIIVSRALRGGPLQLSAYTVHDSHFRGGDPAQSSDHAGVSARFSLMDQ